MESLHGVHVERQKTDQKIQHGIVGEEQSQR